MCKCLKFFDAVGWAAGKDEWWGAGVVICLKRGADLHMAQLMPLPLTVSSFSKIQIGFTFLVLAYPGSPGKGPLNGCVCVCTGGFKREGGQGGHAPKIPKVTRSPCQPTILVCSSTQNVQFKVGLAACAYFFRCLFLSLYVSPEHI